MWLYTLPCWSVGWSVRPSHFWIASGFCITAPTQPSATVLPCIRPCLHYRRSNASWSSPHAKANWVATYQLVCQKSISITIIKLKERKKLGKNCHFAYSTAWTRPKKQKDHKTRLKISHQKMMNYIGVVELLNIWWIKKGYSDILALCVCGKVNWGWQAS